MAREVTEIEGYGALEDGQGRRFTVASGVKIAKGTVLKHATPRLATASTGTGDRIAGVAGADKSATDLSTSISAWTNGIYEFTASGAITEGDNVVTAAPGNYVKSVTTENTSSHAIIVGTAMKDQKDGNRVQVRMNV